MQVELKVNGKPVSADVPPNTLLVQLLREHLRLTGTHVGCDTAQCGACTVIVNGTRINSCLSLAVQHEGDAVTTIGVSCSSAPTPKAASAEATKVIAVAGFLHTMMRVPKKPWGTRRLTCCAGHPMGAASTAAAVMSSEALAVSTTLIRIAAQASTRTWRGIE